MSDFLDLFVHGIPELDIWEEDVGHVIGMQPNYPLHPRPARPTPKAPHELEARSAELSEAEEALLTDAIYGGAFNAYGISESFSYSKMDPDCMDGWLLLAEVLGEQLDRRGLPKWWEPESYTRETADSLYDALCRAERRYNADREAWAAECARIHRAPETDPAWIAYDKAMAELPARVAAYKRGVLEYAQKKTGFKTREEAEAAYWGRHRYGSNHALLGYRRPADVRVVVLVDVEVTVGSKP